jgi:hypothetical protein
MSILSPPRRNRKRAAHRANRALRYGLFDQLEARTLLATLIQTQSFGPADTAFTNSPLTPTITKFDTNGGQFTLDSVEIKGSSSVTATLSGDVINTSTTATEMFTLDNSVTNVTTSFTGPGLGSGVSNSTATLLDFSTSQTLAPGATFTVPTMTNTLTAGPVDMTLTGGALAPFLGTGTLGPYTTSANDVSTSDFSSGGNVKNDTTFTTQGQAGVTVIYTFHANPTINTTPSGTVVVGSGAKMNDTAVLAGGISPTGNITFTLTDPSNAVVYTDVVPVNGNGSYSTTDATGNNPGGFAPTKSGTYQWLADFTSANTADNSNVSSVKGDEPENAVNALISIAPLTPNNEVGSAEVFTITMHAFPAGTGTPTFALPTVAFPGGAPGTVGPVTPLSGPTQLPDGSWVETWTESINSTVAGTFNVQASDKVIMDSVSVTRTTGDGFMSGDGNDGDSAVKNYVDALISISPLTPNNEVKNAEVFTITVHAFPAGTGTPAFALPVVTFPGGAPGTVGPVTPLSGPTKQPDGTWIETWTETINSTVAGTFNVQASDKVTMGGVAVTRTTGDGFMSGDGSDGPSAVKNYVDALISISPLTPVNEVKNAEVFTITVHAFPAGTGTPAFGVPAVTFPGGAPGTVGPVTPLSGPTQQPDGTWIETWTETINSTVAGTFNVQASDKVTMGGVAVTRTTGDGFMSGDGSDGPSAVKNYVDALIAISPLTAVNPVNRAEVFTITVHAFPAGTGTPSFGLPTVTFPGGAPGTVGPVTPLSGPTQQPDGTWVETWTETINSAVAGTFNVQASDMVTMGGVTVTRTTGDMFTSGDGSDSGSAVKNYVSIATAVKPAGTVTLGTSIFDTAHVSGQVSATGTVTFQLFDNPTGTGTPLFTDIEPVSASGDATSKSTSQPVGSYFWVATYNSNDSNNVTTSSGLASEPQSVTGIKPTVATVILPSSSVALGTSVTDTATIGNQIAGFPATGTVTYTFSGTGGTTLPTLPAGSSFTLVAGTWQEKVTLVTVGGVGTVPNSDPTPALPAGSYQFQASYSGDKNYPGGPFLSAVEPLAVAKGNSSTATTIEDGVTAGTPTNALGETVFDTATVTGTPFTPTGTVTYTFSGTGGTVLPTLPAGSSFTLVAGTWQETVTLTATGAVPNSDTTPQLPAGTYQFVAKYSGDSNYNGSTSGVEPLTINMGNSSTATAIKPSSSVTAGSTVFDTATVTGTPFTPSGTVTYTFSGTGGTVLPPLPTGSSFTLVAGTWQEKVTLTATGTVPNSDTTPALPAGSYQFVAVYSGDSNYKGSTSSVEPLTVTTAVPALTWGFWKNHTGLDSPVDAWPVGNFTITSDGTSTVSYHGVSTTLNGKKVVSNATTMTFGDHTYTFQQLRSIFATPVTGNALISLGHQLIAAILNVANGAGTPAAVDLIQDASDLLATGSTTTPGPLVIGVTVVTSTSDPALYAQLISLESQLDAFNSSGV